MPRPYGPIGLVVSLAAIVLLALLYCLVVLGLAAGLDALIQGGARLHAIIGALRGRFGSSNGALVSLLFALGLFLYVGLLAAIVTIAAWRGGRQWRDLVAWKPWSPLRAGKAYWGFVAAGLVYGVAASAAFSAAAPQARDVAQLPPGAAGAALSFALAVLVGPITEEMAFRGWIFTSLRTRLSFWPANLISAAAFAIAHWEHTHLYAAAIFPLGLMLGAVRERSGSTRASAAFHAIYNAGMLVLDLFVGS